MQDLKRFLTFLSTWYGSLTAAAGTLFPFSTALSNLVESPTPDRNLTAVFSAIVGVAVVAVIFLLVGTHNDRKYASRAEKGVLVTLGILALALFLIGHWLRSHNLIGITQGDDDRLYYFIRGDEERLTPPYRVDWAKGENASYPNYLKTLGYSSFAHGEVFDHDYVSWMSLLFLLVFSAMWGAFTGFFTFVGALAFRKNEYDIQKQKTRAPKSAKTGAKKEPVLDDAPSDSSPPGGLGSGEEPTDYV